MKMKQRELEEAHAKIHLFMTGKVKAPEDEQVNVTPGGTATSDLNELLKMDDVVKSLKARDTEIHSMQPAQQNTETAEETKQ